VTERCLLRIGSSHFPCINIAVTGRKLNVSYETTKLSLCGSLQQM